MSGLDPAGDATASTRPDPLAGLSPIERANTDALLCITDFLPKEAWASLALTSKTMKEKLGEVFETANQCPDSRDGLLDLLDKDLIGITLCYQCSALHCPFKSLSPRGCPCSYASTYSRYLRVPERLTGPMYREIMKRYHRGLGCKTFIDQLNTTRTYMDGNVLKQVANVFKLSPQGLLVRTQQVWSITQAVDPRNQGSFGATPSSRPIQYSELVVDSMAEMCLHTSRRWNWINAGFCIQQEPE